MCVFVYVCATAWPRELVISPLKPPGPKTYLLLNTVHLTNKPSAETQGSHLAVPMQAQLLANI